MRIQRFIAKDMRTALGLVRDALGDDAVILSSGKIGGDVEVTAAIDREVQEAVAHAPGGAPAAVRPMERGYHPDSIEARASRAEAGVAAESRVDARATESRGHES